MIFAFYPAGKALANNLTISNVKIVGWDTTANTCQVQFDITWSNAWRDSTNWDAAWVFIKFTTNTGASPVLWSHATLAPQGHKTTPGVEIVLPTELVSGYKGAFIQFPATTSSHTLTATGTKLVWDYGKDGVSDSQAKAAITAVKVFGIEMVYIPAGSFYAGDTSSSYTFKQGSSDTDPWYITSESAISVTNAASNGYYYTSGGNTGEDSTGSVFTIPVPFPKGYAAFYLMKYELSQGQYRDFLNMLGQWGKQVNRMLSMSSYVYSMAGGTTVMQKRNGIFNKLYLGDPPTVVTVSCNYTVAGGYDQSDDGEWIAMNYLSWPDLAAYADWAALRPMTELEYEKAARGPTTAVSGEYAWGTTNITQVTSISSAGTNGEVAGNASQPLAGLCVYNNHASVQGPLRVGFAAIATGSPTRETSGAGYYGNLELSGNVWERVVTVGNAEGRAFVGTHGDGVLTTGDSGYEGNATNVDWPGIDATSSRGVTGAKGTGLRGGGWTDSSAVVATSRRSSAAYYDTTRYADGGGRLARSAPQ